MEPEKLREIVSENRSLETKLTKRNQQYIFDLKKALAAANLSEEEKTLALHDILPVLVEEQKGGKTARQLFGTVSERTEAIISKPQKPKSSSPWTMWLDNTLLIFGIFSIMISFMALISRGAQVTYGLTTLVLSSAIGGWVFYLMYKYIYRFEQPGADRSQKPGMFKSMAIIVGTTLLWVLSLAATMMLPPVVNPILEPMIVIVLGAIVLAVRYYLKKKYNIVGSLSVPRNR
ncbi:hypothetical protein RV11_GL002375 [Enterococcus phoeniculicola]|jgi:uncharacterized membrane-anchored protein|uniref:Integral membrane protein n=1 Tax=Enterococcus phoeniculicola ATCC BAA-412 TaxID=1158610 RepID=R3WNL2_9ENTE|nr:DUF1129 domain-containing protein [Enterococcus phoeniculicola]EOL49431.1 hypothetical protein UC3_00088 [Enterococcus phoeniculicola ATCC BAA-412]EOT71397.1 hypothetical protein I589_03402 [Enterococcus phoeniculicola ATCC BAA-412]OJG69591.1 hypothetical protein RV11_GL002375 [Enterococcus phoeniculicola]